MTTTLFKIPCIILAAVGLHITTTPPNPPALPSERKLRSAQNLYPLPFTLKIINWAVALAETAAIVANRTPQSRFSREILARLALPGTADRMHISLLFLVGAFSAALGGFIRFACYRELAGRLFTFEIAIRKDHRLVTTGPYSVVRHPSYTGLILAVIGTACWGTCPGSWLRECGALRMTVVQIVMGVYATFGSFIIIGLLMRFPKEEEVLSETFGDEWTRWARTVPDKLIPGVF